MVEIHELYQELKSSNYLVDIDSRKIRNGSIFFGIKGDNFNGNDFVIDALKNGSRLAVTDDENPEFSDNPNIIKVPDAPVSYTHLTLPTTPYV